MSENNTLSPTMKAVLRVVYDWQYAPYPNPLDPDRHPTMPITPTPLAYICIPLAAHNWPSLPKAVDDLARELGYLKQVDSSQSLYRPPYSWALPDGRDLDVDSINKPIADRLTTEIVTFSVLDHDIATFIPIMDGLCPSCHRPVKRLWNDVDTDGRVMCRQCGAPTSINSITHPHFTLTDIGYPIAYELACGTEAFEPYTCPVVLSPGDPLKGEAPILNRPG